MTKQKIEETVGYRVHMARTRQNMTQKELAAKIGLSNESLSRLEKGRVNETRLRFGTMKSLAQALGVTIDYLAWGENGRGEASHG